MAIGKPSRSTTWMATALAKARRWAVIAGIELEDDHGVLGAVGQAIQGLAVARQCIQVAGAIGTVGADVDVEPDLAVMSFGEF